MEGGAETEASVKVASSEDGNGDEGGEEEEGGEGEEDLKGQGGGRGEHGWGGWGWILRPFSMRLEGGGEWTGCLRHINSNAAVFYTVVADALVGIVPNSVGRMRRTKECAFFENNRIVYRIHFTLDNWYIAQRRLKFKYLLPKNNNIRLLPINAAKIPRSLHL